MSLESFIIVPGLVIFRNMMLFLSGQFSWVKSKQATKHRQRDPPPLALPVGCLYSIVCLYTVSSAAALCSLASSCPAKPDLTQAKLPLQCFLATASKSAERKKIGRGSFVDVYMCARCVCVALALPGQNTFIMMTVLWKWNTRKGGASPAFVSSPIYCGVFL